MTTSDGLFNHAAALISAKLAYFRARIELAGIEGKEAAAHLAVIVAMGIGALVVAIFGYLFFVIALVFLIAWACGGGNAWIWVTLGTAIAHFVLAVGLASVAKIKLSRPLFPATLDEFKKDQEWLKNPANPN